MVEGLLKILVVEASVIAHATEDLDKVQTALKNIMPADILGDITLSKSHLEGHHRNPITLLKAEVKGRKATESFVRNLASSLTDDDKKKLSYEFRDHVDEEGSLFIRLDKQAAFLGRLRMKEEDPVRVRVRFAISGRKVEEISEACKTLGLIP